MKGGPTFRNRFAREQKEDFRSTNPQAKALLVLRDIGSGNLIYQ